MIHLKYVCLLSGSYNISFRAASQENIAITSGDFRFALALPEAADDSRVTSQIVYTQKLYAQSQRNTDMSESECSDSDSESDWSGFSWHMDLPDQMNDEPGDSEQELEEESDEEAGMLPCRFEPVASDAEGEEEGTEADREEAIDDGIPRDIDRLQNTEW